LAVLESSIDARRRCLRSNAGRRNGDAVVVVFQRGPHSRPGLVRGQRRGILPPAQCTAARERTASASLPSPTAAAFTEPTRSTGDQMEGPMVTRVAGSGGSVIPHFSATIMRLVQ